ncbi:3'-5' exonuclease [Candidatus Nomurabacteria bacterium]|nr:3'-5' exonuclease [Candidatus Kaiserbacteria bacterium]MCB9814002.1 3'-5' exonuclease [Candidatus Nomurabacteria bacterium]
MLILDIEASGTNYEKHSIVSIGALDFNQPDNRFYEECHIWDGAHIMDGALEVNGFTEEQITDSSKLSEAELVEKFLQWTEQLQDRTLCGQNVSFDRDMLRAGAERAGLNWTLAYRTLDTHTMCWMHMIKSGLRPPLSEEHKHSTLNLDGVLNYCGIPSEPDPHNALTGALCHAEVASRLLNDVQLLPEFKQYPIPWL